ncbi:hypothetical protein E1267_20720 [Nonomuraea longispora]|uniref:Uncharacterized protein n=1 Tax=Nonomuraea longispora TaxID=1848320 RepID=A0A4R4N8E2_9ACTN|nr:hypothetical protein [Nonomuraea longispora]TDC05095.1 hypothetical protein E1267_20720 [Nonomuraea longispora]
MSRKAITALTLAACMLPGAALAAPASADAENDLSDCYDGTCTLTVTEPVTFPVDPRYRLSDVRVSKVHVAGMFHAVMIQSTKSGAATTLGAGTRGSINGLSVHVQRITDTDATVRFEG